MMKRYAIAAAVGLLLVSLIGCSKEESTEQLSSISAQPQMQKPPKPIPVDSKIVSGSNRFGMSLLKKLASEDTHGNIFISPASAAYALTMTYNGADGATKNEMAKVLGISGMTLENVDKGYNALSRSLESADPQVELSIANSLWGRQDVSIDPNFIDRGRRHFSAEVHDLSGGVEAINDWADSKTKGKIPKIIDELDPGTVMVLMNAVYFKGKWSKPFEKADTKNRDFYRAGGVSKVATMSKREMLSYYGTKDFQAARLPYGNERLAMYIFLPRKGLSPLQLCQRMDESRWSDVRKDLAPVFLSLYLPTFRISWRNELKPALQSLGMRQAFDGGKADFRGISKFKPLLVTSVVQETFLDVNEVGTEAAAATAVAIGMGRPKEETMDVNRPFLCMIVDDYTKAILFAGIINQPE